MSKKNPTWLDEYYLVVKKAPCESLQRIFGCDVLDKNEARRWVIWFVNNAELIEKKEWPSGQFDWHITCHSEETGWVRLLLVFSNKLAPGSDKKTVYFDRITKCAAPEFDENPVATEREV